MSENNFQENTPSFGRKNFIKLAALTLGAAAVGNRLGQFVANRPDILHSEPLPLSPEIVDGVAIYGLKEKIDSVDQVKGFYAFLDAQFAQTNNINIVNKEKSAKNY